MSGFKVTLRGSPTGPREYVCPEHGPFEMVVALATSSTPQPCPVCSMPSERGLDANIVARSSLVSFARGKGDEPPPYATTTAALADGMPLSEWKANRRKLWKDRDWNTAKAKGLI